MMLTTIALPSRKLRVGPPDQQGIVLLEALIGLLIFAVGILGLIGLQAASVKQAAAAEYRSTAALQANDLISRMWVSDRTADALKAQYASPDAAGYSAWASQWQSALPGADIAANAPTVTFTMVDGGGLPDLATKSSQVTVVVYWQAPGEKDRHNYTVVAQLK